jgi:hypothetical protein
MKNLSFKIIAYLGRKPDFTQEILLEDDGTGAKILKWNATDKVKPTDEQLNELESEATKIISNNKVDSTRRTAYGSWNDQLDEIYHDMDAWKARLQIIKTNNPKS